MNRRKFILATGSTTIGASTIYKLTQEPSLAVNGNLGLENISYTVRNDEAGDLGSLKITLDSVDITTANIDKEDVDVTIIYERNDIESEESINIDGIPNEGSSYELIEDISDLAPDENGGEESYKFDVTIEVSHDDVSTQTLEDEFTFDVLKEIIDDVKFVTTDEYIEVENDNKVDESDGITTGIIKTGVIEEMTTLGED